ncbi:MAG: hypothetical protein KJ720_18655 [Proteobacteria bacterium]|nr:hypothetical protein [Pseudomonadota bacterium]MBU1451927.1 hypothetical protein [Pseudomonadota bacterium]MBU2516734.1 hypothetical protein [Pseudomonadota bacterium]
MRKNLDIFFGLAAWAIGILAVMAAFWPFWKFGFTWMEWVAPSLWTLCVILMFVISKRRPIKLWWVWPSFPLAFVLWVSLIVLVLGGY